jgi:hypothetical protein
MILGARSAYQALLKVDSLQVKLSSATLFVRSFTVSMLRLVTQRDSEDLATGGLLMTGKAVDELDLSIRQWASNASVENRHSKVA